MTRTDFLSGISFAAATMRSPSQLRLAADVLGTNPDPYEAAVAGIDTLAWLFGDGLVTFERGMLRPLLTRALPRVSADALRVDYQLRDDLRWHDGSPVVAHDVEAAFERVAQSGWASSLPYDAIDRIDVRGSSAFSVRLHRPVPDFVETFFAPYGRPALPLLRAGAFPIGTGPFRIERDPVDPSAFRLSAYLGSPRGVPHVATIRVRLENVNATRGLGLLTGETDIAFPLDRAEIRLAGMRHYRIPTSVLFLMANMSGPLGDAALRSAVFSAIDVARLRRNVYPEMSAETPSLVPSGAPGHELHPPDRYDPEAAKVYFRSKPIQPLRIATQPGRQEDVAVVVASYLTAAGAVVKIERVDGRVFESRLGPLRTGRFDIAIGAAAYTRHPDLGSEWSCRARAPNGSNYANYCDRRFDSLVQSGNLSGALRELYESDAIRMLVEYSEVVGVAPRVRGFVPPEPLVPLTLHAERWALA